jgi:L-ascorbate metabolism protein UlaG (beta-lactamase superfamily)
MQQEIVLELEAPVCRWSGKRKIMAAMAAAAGVMIMSVFAWTMRFQPPAYEQSPQFRDGRFHNAVPRPTRSFFDGAALWYAFLFDKPAGTTPDRVVPVRTLTQTELLAAPDNSVWRLGHSSLLLKLHDKFWLTDPVFSERSSPVQWFGPKRFHAPPVTLDELPPIEAVIISHNHYDHLDHATIMALHQRVKHFIAPLGIGATLVSWGVPANKVRELDWWDRTSVDGIRVVATPARHFSGRSTGDADRTLWASWVITGNGFNLFFSGDSGYFDGFKEIGRRFGPFDVAFLEAGAYDTRWEAVHMLPEQTVQAFHDLGGKWLVPIHNGTFDLAMHAWNDPMGRVTRLASERAVPVSTPEIGERVGLFSPDTGRAWWRD